MGVLFFFFVVVVLLFPVVIGKIKLSIWCFACFLKWNCVAINFPLRTAFAALHRFQVVMFSLSFVSRKFFIYLLIFQSPVGYLEMYYLISMCLCFLHFFFLVIDIQSHRVVVRQDAWYKVNFLKCTEFWFVTQDAVYPRECPICTWEEGVFFWIWMECPEDINEIHLI